MASLSGVKIAILITDGFEQIEMTEPRKAFTSRSGDSHCFAESQSRTGMEFHQLGR